MDSERGFTLPELLVTTFVLLLAFIFALGLLRPANYTLDDQNSQRRTDLSRLAVALRAYHADNGAWPDGLPSQPTNIATLDETVDLCKVLVPKYMKDLPYDPVTGTKSSASLSLAGDGTQSIETDEPCNGDDVGYSTGYMISRSKDDTIRLEAETIIDDSRITLKVRP